MSTSGALVIEMDTNVGIALCRFDNGCVKRRPPDRIDTFFRIDIIRRKMQLAGFIVNHPAAHRNRVLQCFLSDADLFQRVNPACRNRQIDRASADDVPFARVSAPLVKIHLVSAPSEICGEQSASQIRCRSEQILPLRKNLRIRNAGKQEKPTSGCPIRFTASDTDALQFLERVAEVIKNVARQQRLLALVAVEDCDLRCATA